MVKTYKIGGEWIGKTAGGCLNYATWRFNPQLFFTSAVKKVIKIKLVQLTEDDLHPAGVYVVLADPSQGKRRQLVLTKEQLVAKTLFETKKEMVLEVEIDAGKEYFVIPCTFHPQLEGKFQVQFSSDGELKFRMLTPESEWNLMEEEGAWSGRSAGGCRNHSTCKFNPQYLIEAPEGETDIIIVLHQHKYEEFDTIGYYLVKTPPNTTAKVSKLASPDIFGKCQYQSPREACAKFTIPENCSLVLLPSTFDPNHEAPFSLFIFSDNPISALQLPEKQEVRMNGEWNEESCGGSLQYPTWRSNPQYFLFMNQSHQVTISLAHKVPPTSADDMKTIGFYLLKPSESNYQADGYRLVIVKKDQILYRPTFERKASVSHTFKLEKSKKPYVIIPCTQQPDEIEQFTLSIFVDDFPDNAENAKECIDLLPCNYSWTTKCLRGRWKGDSAAGNRTSPTFFKNPQLCLRAFKPGHIEIVLVCRSANITAPVGMYLVKTHESSRIQKIIESELVATSAFESREASMECNIAENQHYTLIPCTAEPMKDGLFEVFVYSDVEAIELEASGSSIMRNRQEIVPHSQAGRRGSAPNPQMEKKTMTLGELRKWQVEFKDITIQEKVGQGGFGAVFRGLWKNAEVAVKKMQFRDEEEATTFKKEIYIMSKFEHPNIVGFIGACIEANEICIISEFADRGDLSNVLKKDPDLAWDTKIKLAIDSAAGMLYLHTQKPPIVHRDLKSLNLLVDKNWNCKVADFGLSKATSGQSMNSRMGSLNWCAPEIMLNGSPYTPMADIYSFGIVLHELLTHQVPYGGMSPLQVVRAKDRGEVPPIPPTTHKDYKRLIEDCWRNRPEQRPDFATIKERLQALIKDGKTPNILLSEKAPPKVPDNPKPPLRSASMKQVAPTVPVRGAQLKPNASAALLGSSPGKK